MGEGGYMNTKIAWRTSEMCCLSLCVSSHSCSRVFCVDEYIYNWGLTDFTNYIRNCCSLYLQVISLLVTCERQLIDVGLDVEYYEHQRKWEKQLINVCLNRFVIGRIFNSWNSKMFY